MKMYDLWFLIATFGPALSSVGLFIALCYLYSLNFHTKECKRLLKDLLDLEVRRLGASSAPVERSASGEGFAKAQAEKVSQIESYGDLSNVGRLKTPKT